MELTTRRLRLREFKEEDWRATLAYQKDPRYLQFYEWEERNEPEVKHLIEMFIHWQKETPRRKYQLAVCLAGEDELIGNCGIRKDRAEARLADMGYEIAPQHWGRGYATEAARRIVQFGFEALGVERITAEFVEENARSRRVLEKAGLKFDHRREARLWFKGRDWNTLVYAIEAPGERKVEG